MKSCEYSIWSTVSCQIGRVVLRSTNYNIHSSFYELQGSCNTKLLCSIAYPRKGSALPTSTVQGELSITDNR